jgi:hypothetical protein
MMGMARPRLRLDGTILRFEEIVAPKRRDLSEADFERFATWSRRYLEILEYDKGDWRKHRETGLVSLGREMFAWLDDGRFFSDGMADVPPPWIIDIVVDDRRFEGGLVSVRQLRFLDAPWELLADADDFLAADPVRRLETVRRIGQPLASPPDAQRADRLSVLFMAAAPEDGGDPLAFEREEYAILQARAGRPLDLFVDDSGELAAMHDHWANRLAGTDVVHFSGHGDILNDGPTPAVPVLVLEDEDGQSAPTTPDQVAAAFESGWPRLIVLASCRTGESPAPAVGTKVVEAFAPALVSRGAPAAIGFAASVFDTEATRFGETFYAQLSTRGRSLEAAFAAARRNLINGDDKRPGRSPDWSLPRLYLSSRGGGTWSFGDRPRTLPPDAGATNVIAAHTRPLEVARRTEFVGRRRELKRIRRAFAGSDTPQPVLIHGFGGQGKTSLAARIIDRFPHLTPVALADTFSAQTVLDALERKLSVELREAIANWRPRVRDNDEELLPALIDILKGPCGYDAKPILLLLDDLEKALAPPAGADEASRFDDVATERALRAILGAFGRVHAENATPSRLLMTCRFRFRVLADGKNLADESRVVHVPLPDMREADREKQLDLKLRALLATGGDITAAQLRLVPRVPRLAYGNARLQDLLTRTLVSDPDLAQETLDALQSRRPEQLREVDLPALHVLLESVAIDHLLAALSEGDRRLLRAALSFPLPVPLAALTRAAPRLGWGDGRRLSDLGLWTILGESDASDDGVAVPNALVGQFGGLDLLPEDELKIVAASLSPDWLRHCGERADQTGNPHQARLFFELSLTAAGSATDADSARARASAILRQAELLVRRGEVDDGERLAIGAAGQFQSIGDARGEAVASGTIARIKVSRGDVDGALALHEEMLRIFERLGDTRERAVTLGDIARIKVSRGDVDGALALHEEELAIYERLGDTRSRAVTLGDIARIKVSRGDVDGALALHEERLGVYERLGDTRSRAVTLGDIARIKVSRGDVDGALALHEERLGVHEAMGDQDGIASANFDIGQILVGRIAEASAPREEDVERAFRTLARAWQILNEIRRVDGVLACGSVFGQFLLMGGDAVRAVDVLSAAREAAGVLQQQDAIAAIDRLVAAAKNWDGTKM